MVNWLPFLLQKRNQNILFLFHHENVLIEITFTFLVVTSLPENASIDRKWSTNVEWKKSWNVQCHTHTPLICIQNYFDHQIRLTLVCSQQRIQVFIWHFYVVYTKGNRSIILGNDVLWNRFRKKPMHD